MIDTRFWDDNYVSNLDPIEKLLFLYFLTNPSTNICGIYELPLKSIAADTGIDKEMVIKVINRFEKEGKIFYRNGWIGVKNFIKHQNQNSPHVKKGIDRELESVPEDIKALVFGEGIDTVSHLTKLNLTKPNLTKLITRAKRSSVTKELDGKEVNELITLFKEINPSYEQLFSRRPQRAATSRLLEKFGREKLESMIRFLPTSNGARYGPTITTPLELEGKLGALKAWADKQRDTGNKILTV